MVTMMHPLVVAVLLGFAVARATGIVVDDTVTLPLRRAVLRRFGPKSSISVLVHCHWCVGWWVSVLAVTAAVLAGQLPVHPVFQLAAAPAVAQLAALIRAHSGSR